jgi:hypothetical protein
LISGVGLDEASAAEERKKRFKNTEMESVELTDEMIAEIESRCFAEYELADLVDDDKDGSDVESDFEDDSDAEDRDKPSKSVGVISKRYNFGDDRVIRPRKDECCVCLRTLPLTWHHLIPRCTHTRMMKKHGYTKDELDHRGIWVCRACHSAIHGSHENRELAEKFNTLETLLACEKIQKWIGYISKRKVTAHGRSDTRLLKYSR